METNKQTPTKRGERMVRITEMIPRTMPAVAEPFP